MPVGFLNDFERERLSCFPAEIASEDIVAFFTLSSSDLAHIPKTTANHNRLGFALQLCAMRYLGFCPDKLTTAPSEVVAYIAHQLSITPNVLALYGEREQTRTDHLQQIQAYLGFRKVDTLELRDLVQWLVERAIEHDKPTLLFQLVCEKLYRDKIIRPGVTRIEKIVATARRKAQKETFFRLAPLLTKEHCVFLDKLLVIDPKKGRTLLNWLKEGATSNSAAQILVSLEKLIFLRQAGIDQWDLSMLNPNRVKFLAQVGRKATNQYLQRLNEERRYPILIAILKQSLIDITDEIIEMYDQCLWGCYTDAKKDLEAFQKSVARSKNEKLRFFRDIGLVLMNPKVPNVDVRTVCFKYVSSEILQKALEETNQIIRPNDDGYFDYLARRYSYIRRFAPTFLSAFSFLSDKPNDSLLKAIDLICELDKKGLRCRVPKDAPHAFVSKKWKPYIFGRNSGEISRCYYELCVLWELRNAFRAGNVWISNSRRYANPNTYLIPPQQWPALRQEVCQLINVPQDGSVRLKEREVELAELLPRVEHLFSYEGSGLRFEKGKIVVSPLKAEERPESAIALEKAIAERLPRVEITDLLIEVDSWTQFSNHFEHATGNESKTKELSIHLYASILALACNFGLEQMAQITDISYRQLAWCTSWYIREETLKSAITALVNYHYHQPLSQVWGGGTLSSSDGQRFPVAVKTRIARALPRYFGYGMGLTFYSWTSDQLSQWGSKHTSSTTRDATYVLDEILDNETELPLFEHTTDTAGYTELIFALFDLLGFRFSPRIRDLKDQCLYRMGSIDLTKYKILKQCIKAVINRKRIMEHWDDFLRLAGSLKLGWVTASLLIQKLLSSPQKSALTKALQEYGRILKTIHILRWYESEENRRRINCQLNKGEALHGLRSFLCFANKGFIRRRHEDELKNQASCLNLVTNAVIIWNTIYMSAAIEQLKIEGYPVQESDLKHLWPTHYEHINVHGKYQFNVDEVLKRKGLRPLRQY
jgi:TnpA family transposase